MFEPSLDYDPILQTVYTALQLVPSACTALDSLSHHWPDKRSADAGRQLSVKLAKGQMFKTRDLEDLQCFLAQLQASVDAGRCDELICDPHCDGNDYIRQSLTAEAADLQAHMQPVQTLARTLQQLAWLRRAEQIAMRLRQQDQG